MFASVYRSLILSLAAGFLSTAASAGTANNTIVIGQAIDLSGPNASIGRDYVAGIKTHFDAVNSAGGIQGKQIVYLVRDDQGRPDQSARVASELIERDQVDYLFGGIGDDNARAVLDAPAFRRSSHVLFAPLASVDPAATAQAGTKRILFWRPGYAQELRHIFSHFSKLGITDVGIVYQDSAANQQAYRSVMETLQEQRMKLAGTARIGMDNAQIVREASRLASARPGFILVIADTIGTAQFLKAYRKQDAQTFVAGTSLINLSTLRELAGPAAVEWTVFSQVVPNPASGATLLQIEHLNMMKKYRDETVSSLTLEGFAAAKALTKAIQQSRRGGRLALQEFMAQGGDIDLGGLSVGPVGNGSRLSDYLDIALFTKGSGLKF